MNNYTSQEVLTLYVRKVSVSQSSIGIDNEIIFVILAA